MMKLLFVIGLCVFCTHVHAAPMDTRPPPDVIYEPHEHQTVAPVKKKPDLISKVSESESRRRWQEFQDRVLAKTENYRRRQSPSSQRVRQKNVDQSNNIYKGRIKDIDINRDPGFDWSASYVDEDDNEESFHSVGFTRPRSGSFSTSKNTDQPRNWNFPEKAINGGEELVFWGGNFDDAGFEGDIDYPPFKKSKSI